MVFGLKGDDTMKSAPKEEHTNRLIQESSPYLLQHAHNPVDWYPWGDEAFERAQALDRPIFLSIGYSTCHWCHVMERESFENERIAAVMNEHFVSVKVDREQRPDVDSVYMNAVQVMTGSGGWPLSAWLTPEGKPFYGGTYFPAHDSFGRPGFEKVLLAIADAWENRRAELIESAGKITEVLSTVGVSQAGGDVSVELLDSAYEQLESTFDPVHGGFGSAPKFPQPGNLLFLLAYYHRTQKAKALEMVETTLTSISHGGLYDHLGGGFARYSTDAEWLVPHFEKMLYDQGLLSLAYVQAYQITRTPRYANVVREVFDYVLREMTDGKGGFYSAEDADSEGVEGKFYVWDVKEIEEALGRESAGVFAKYYGVTEGGNFEHGKSILNVSSTVDALAEESGKEPAEIRAMLARGRRKLFDAREKRIRPHRDDKVIAAWNGLMIAAMAYGGAALGEKKYVDAAEKAARFVLRELRKDGRLLRFYRDDKAVGVGFLDDCAFMLLGLLELYEATWDARWLAEANAMAGQMSELFADEKGGGFFRTGDDSEKLIVRSKPSYDGAVPSGNSIAALALLRLGRITVDKRFSALAEDTLKWAGPQAKASPLSLTAMLLAADLYLGPTQEIVIAGDIGDAHTNRMLRVLHETYLPRAVALFHDPSDNGRAIRELVPFIESQSAMDGKATAYVCEGYVCKRPVVSVDELKDLIGVKE